MRPKLERVRFRASSSVAELPRSWRLIQWAHCSTGLLTHWPVEGLCEITLEANPSSVESARFAGYRSAGVNRVSLGVQSLADEQLRFLGRLHTATEAREAIAIAVKHFDRMSFDLIYARPGQTESEWRAELGEALALARGHLSLYQLTIEPETAFFDLSRRGKLTNTGAGPGGGPL